MMWLISRRYRRKQDRVFLRVRRFRPRLEALDGRIVPSTLTVLNNHDSGAGSLRHAITHAQDGDTIVFDASLGGQTITLTSGQLKIKNSVDIEGPGADKLAISGGDTDRIFHISTGLTVTIAGLTITHGRAGHATNNSGGGGGILNDGGNLTLAEDVLSECVDDGGPDESQGGAVSNVQGGTLTVTDSTFLDNRADGPREQQLRRGGRHLQQP